MNTQKKEINPEKFKDAFRTMLIRNNLGPSEFADIIKVSRSTISHLLSGRNKPNFEFVQKINTEGFKGFSELLVTFLMFEDTEHFYDSVAKLDYKKTSHN